MERIVKGKILCAFVVVLSAGPLKAQQSALDVHLDYARGTQTHINSWGAGAAIQFTWGSTSAPVQLNTSLGGDYTKQENGGPGTASGSVDLTVQPGGGTPFTPYAGVSASENWSTGNNKAWSGARMGREVLAGFQYKPSGWKMSFKAEERYGYIDDQEHTLTTRAGVIFSF